MYDNNIFHLFAKPVYHNNIGRNLTKEENDFILENCDKSKTFFNLGNYTSNDTYILENPVLAELKQDIEMVIDGYVQNIINPVDGFNLYITQSWLNIAEPGRFHNLHTHANSILSGVFYFDVDEKSNFTIFHDDESYENYGIQSKQTNYYNSREYAIELEKNDVIVFASNMRHSVPPNKSDKPRISLSFNTFFKGTCGNENDSNLLTLY